jgi:endonuclease/exonuclease/phosphatase family metal-dependent hydrolase
MTNVMPAHGGITVATYNVGNGLATPARLARFVRECGADLVGLQEVDSAQADALARDAIAQFPYQVLRGAGFSGRGLLSRFPILESEWLELAPDRPDLRATVSSPSADVTVIVAHPPPPRLRNGHVVFSLETLVQIDRLAQLATESRHSVLLGDLNMTARHPSYLRLIEAGLVDSFRAAGAGRGATFPARPGRMQRFNHRLSWLPLPPFARFDYIWHTPDLEPLTAWVERGAGSDHLPLFARLTATEH